MDPPPEYREACDAGLAATATVLGVRKTHWRTGRELNFRLEVSPRRWEYAFRLRVTRDGMPEYEAETTEFLRGDEVPDVGDAIPVRVHPLRPEIVVLALPRSRQARSSTRRAS